ncbi:N-acetylmuramoyl-L-alanine amidase [Rhodococcus sp. ARC_M6]|uniref:N-acetylmuramoyl-L-alanine amidase n=1 Tax=Rhodococcus sp. ARC_M6 TaxID=2928852 RepID=UPI001FB410A8|nr:N-acetylmuramoyl-L-alanine amidase [Rhodococcus sp. ARC_M6]MCJ0905210.1 N-acetylmuramoyl-L-alanine amidase [Rhodococcus sp. ARC_M6]
MPQQRRSKFSLVLGSVVALAVASPLISHVTTSTSVEVRSTQSALASESATQIADVVLATVPDLSIPLEELTGVDLSALLRLGLNVVAGSTGSALPTNDLLPRPTVESEPSPMQEIPPEMSVKEITREDPFRMVALTSSGLTAPAAAVRARQSDGGWGPWLSTSSTDTLAGRGLQGTDPVFVGTTNAVQLLVPSIQDQSVPDEQPSPLPPDVPAPATAYAPAALAQPLVRSPGQNSDVSAVLIEPGSGPASPPKSDGTDASPGFSVISRAQWGADESLRCEEPVYDEFLGGAVVHHTAGSNEYSKEESADIVRGIYAYHAQTLGWCDIGYNALVDKYGQIFEGRAGGLDKPVQGAHTGGFNENTVGVAMMGDYTSEEPTSSEINTVGTFLGWRLKLAALDPLGRTTMYSEGTEFTSFPEGAAVDVPIISAHRDLGNTADPGEKGYAQMDTIRNIAASYSAGSDPAPQNTAVPDNTRLNPLLGKEDPKPEESATLAKWTLSGARDGPLGHPVASDFPTPEGIIRSNYQHGAIYEIVGNAWVILGRIYEAWKALGAENSTLGLPISDEYHTVDGERSDFEGGSLLFDTYTGTVTRLP